MQRFYHTIQSGVGLHARPASMLTQQAQRYESRIHVEYEDKTANAKSIMSLFALAARQGAEVCFIIEGEDEKKAAEELEEFCKKNI